MPTAQVQQTAIGRVAALPIVKVEDGAEKRGRVSRAEVGIGGEREGGLSIPSVSIVDNMSVHTGETCAKLVMIVEKL